jgi:hypothetical protein
MKHHVLSTGKPIGRPRWHALLGEGEGLNALPGTVPANNPETGEEIMLSGVPGLHHLAHKHP